MSPEAPLAGLHPVSPHPIPLPEGEGEEAASPLSLGEGQGEGPGRSLPAGWAWAQLDQLVSLRREKIQPDRTSDFPFIGMEDVPPGSLQIAGHGWLREMKSAANAIEPGDILYGRLRPYLNKVVLSNFRGAASGEFIVIAPRDGIDSRYIQLTMHARKFVNFAARDTTGDRPRIDFDKIAKFQIAIPPSNEQRRIVARIDELFAEIAEGEAALARARQGLETWRRALLKAAVTGELTREWRESNKPAETGADLLARIRTERAKRTSKLGRAWRSAELKPLGPLSSLQLPDGWTWSSIGEVIDRLDYGTSEKCGPDEEGVPVLRMGNIQDGRIDATHLKYASLISSDAMPILEAGDILFNRTNSAELLGKSAVYNGLPSHCSFASYLVRLRARSMNPGYVVFWLNSVFGKAWIAEHKSQQVGQANLSGGKLMTMPIPVPSAEEQNHIAHQTTCYLTALDDMHLMIENTNRDHVLLRQSILKAAFEGRLVPQDPGDEPAAALLARLRAERPPSPQPSPRGRGGRRGVPSPSGRGSG